MVGMERRFNFTKVALDGVPIPTEQKKVRYWDTGEPGLMLLVTERGYKTFYVYRKVQGKPEEIKIGPWPDVKVEQARGEARKIKGKISSGENPQDKKRQQRLDSTFGDLWEWFFEKHAKPRKKSWRTDEFHYNKHLSLWASTKCSKITKVQVRELHDRLSNEVGIYTANRVLELVRSIYNRAISHEIIQCQNPAIGIESFREVSRDRRLLPNEITTFFEAVGMDSNEDIRDYIYISLFTGARQANVLSMRWEQVDLEAATWRIPETKNGMPQTLPLGEAEVKILKRRQATNKEKAKTLKNPTKDELERLKWVFPGRGETGHMVEPKSGWNRIIKRAGISDLRMHDLRRTLGSWMVDTGATLAVIGKTLNHQNQATTAIYARLSMDPVRQAKDKAVEAMLEGIDLEL